MTAAPDCAHFVLRQGPRSVLNYDASRKHGQVQRCFSPLASSIGKVAVKLTAINHFEARGHRKTCVQIGCNRRGYRDVGLGSSRPTSRQ